MLDKIFEGFETSDDAKKVEKENRLKGREIRNKKLGKKKVARGRGNYVTCNCKYLKYEI